jgi:hypothetical protein
LILYYWYRIFNYNKQKKKSKLIRNLLIILNIIFYGISLLLLISIIFIDISTINKDSKSKIYFFLSLSTSVLFAVKSILMIFLIFGIWYRMRKKLFTSPLLSGDNVHKIYRKLTVVLTIIAFSYLLFTIVLLIYYLEISSDIRHYLKPFSLLLFLITNIALIFLLFDLPTCLFCLNSSQEKEF